MQTRKDLLAAHRLMTQRANQALILGEPDSPEFPLKRINVAAFSGMCVAILVAAGFGIFGLIKPGGAKAIEKAGMILIEKESGGRYVWCQGPPGTKLCPVANYTSAKIMSSGGGGGSPSQKNVSRNSIAKYERGPMIGIPGLPDTLPGSKHLVKMPWAACVRTVDSPTEGRVPMVTLVGGKQVGGTPLREDQALVVKDGQQPWILWRNQRLRVDPPEAAEGLAPNPPAVAGKWLNSVPTGPDYKAPEITDRGKKVRGPDGQTRRVGVVYNVQGGASYVLMSDGIAPITEVERDLLLIHPDTKQAYGGQRPVAIPIDAGAVGGADKSQQQVSRPELPPTRPSLVAKDENSALCSLYTDSSGRTGGKLAIGGTLPGPPGATNPDASGADQLVFPPGKAALAAVQATIGRPETVNAYFLVAEGRRFPLASNDVAGKLGYDLSKNSVRVPAALVELISEGPKLDPASAQKEVPPPNAPPEQPGN